MIAIFISVVLYALLFGVEVSLLREVLGAGTLAVPGAAVAATLLGSVFVAFGKKKLGARLVQCASIFFLPVGFVGILGARHVLGENEPKVPPDSPGKPAACFRVGGGAVVAGGVALALAGLLVGGAVAAAGVMLLVRGIWGVVEPAVRISQRHIELNRSMWAPRRVIRRKEVDSYDLTGNRLLVVFQRERETLTETVRLWGMSSREREKLGAALDALLASKKKKDHLSVGTEPQLSE